ncbi:Flp family type IVb pilin [Halovulum sp. GXIMD14794]
MLGKLKALKKDEDGAVTVDWVVLTASIVALNVFAVLSMIKDGIRDAGADINEKIEEVRNW